MTPWICLLGLTAAVPTPAQEVAYTRQEGTPVRSGPGETFYVTELLPAGQEVEVYRYDEQEWAAIRPPSSSFSWIPANAVQKTARPELGIVTRDQVPVRVGSSEEPSSRSVSHVRLRKGDRVKLLSPHGQIDSPKKTGRSESWIKIAPPAGEFRWVHRTALDFEASPGSSPVESLVTAEDGQVRETEARHSSDADGEYDIVERPHGQAVAVTRVRPARTRRRAPTQEESKQPEKAIYSVKPTSDVPTVPRETHVALAQWAYDLAPRTSADAHATRNKRTSSEEPRSLEQAIVELRQAVDQLLPPSESTQAESVSSGETVGSSLRLASNDEGLLMPPPGVSEDSPQMPMDPVPRTGGGVPTTGESKTWLLRNELGRVAADLSRIVIQDPLTWDLAPLRNRTRAIIDASETADVREQAQQLLIRIAQFDDLQRRFKDYEQRFAKRNTTTGTRQLLNARTPGQAPPENAPPIDVTQYDGYGWLMPVVTGNPHAPRYVLTDNEGNILQFVTPSPGLNLRPYENKRVGIFGQRSFLSSMKQPQLVAERVVSIDRLR